MKWLRKRLAWIAGVAVGGMVLWLIFSATTLQHAQEKAAGTLFGKPVPAAEYRRALEAVLHDAILRFGDRYRQEVKEDAMQRQAWERLMLLKEANRLGIRVSDREVIDEIQKVFQTKDGRFDQPGYETVIRYSLGTTPRVYEEETRGDLAIRKLFDRSLGEPTVSESDVREEFRKREEKVRVEYWIFPRYALAVEVADGARQDPSQLEKAARQLDLKKTTTDFFKQSESVPNWGPASPLFDAVFKLQPGESSSAVPTPATDPASGQPRAAAEGWAVVRLKERQSPDDSKLAAEKEKLEKQLINQKKMNAYFTWYQDLLKRANPSG